MTSHIRPSGLPLSFYAGNKNTMAVGMGDGGSIIFMGHGVCYRAFEQLEWIWKHRGFKNLCYGWNLSRIRMGVGGNPASRIQIWRWMGREKVLPPKRHGRSWPCFRLVRPTP